MKQDLTRKEFLNLAGRSGAWAAALLGVGPLLTQCTPATQNRKDVGGKGKERWFGTGKTVTRRDIASMGDNDATLLAFREGIKILRQRSRERLADSTGWTAFANQHALYCSLTDFMQQVHYGWMVLPWHRGYLVMLEKLIQDAIADDTFALPYWDWTKHPQMPRQYFGEGNPLVEPTRQSIQTDIIPSDFINIAPILHAPSFDIFGGYPRLDPAKPQIEGILEQSCHNNIHNWIGGHMARFPSSALDPLFSGHHGNVDRMWDAWRAFDPSHTNPTDPRWLDHSFSFVAPDGSVILLDCKELQDAQYLGYQFADLNFDVRTEAEVERAAGKPTQRELADSTTQEVTVQGREKIFSAMATGRNRVVVQMERVAVLSAPVTIRVFLSTPDKATSLDGANYLGTFTILPIDNSTAGGLDPQVNIQLEVDTRFANLVREGAPLELTLVPVELRGRPTPPQTVLKAATLKVLPV